MIYLLCAVLCLAVGIMLSYHLWTISWGETSVEGQDHEVYRRRAKSREEVCGHTSLAAMTLTRRQDICELV